MAHKRVIALFLGIACSVAIAQHKKESSNPEPVKNFEINHLVPHTTGKVSTPGATQPGSGANGQVAPTGAGIANGSGGSRPTGRLGDVVDQPTHGTGQLPKQQISNNQGPPASSQPSIWGQIAKSVIGGIQSRSRTQVPNVVNMTASAAEEQLRSKHLQGTCVDSSGETVEKQYPPAGELVSEWSVVRLTCKTAMKTVPLLEEKTPEEAKTILEKSQLNLGRVSSDPSTNAASLTQIVFRQSPQAGTAVDLNTPVNVWLRAQPAPVGVTGPGGTQTGSGQAGSDQAGSGQTVTNQGVVTQAGPGSIDQTGTGDEGKARKPVVVPNVVGKRDLVANRILRGYGLVPLLESGAKVSPNAKVIAQDPVANTEVTSGSSVSLKFEVILATVPDLVGKSSEEARQQLAMASLGESTGFENGANPNDALVVKDQSPEGGSQVDVQSVVHITLGNRDGISPTVVVATALCLCAVGGGVWFLRRGGTITAGGNGVRARQLRTLSPPTVTFITTCSSTARYSGDPPRMQFVLRLTANPDSGRYKIKRQPSVQHPMAVLDKRRTRWTA